MPLQTTIRIYRGLYANLPLLAQGELALTTDTGQVWIGDGFINRLVGGARVPDGNRGDITVSDSGESWEINARAVGAAEIAAVANQRVLGRNTAGSGDVEEVTVSEFLDWIAGTPAEGDMLIRGASGWERLPKSTLADARLTHSSSNGTSWEPSWVIQLEDQKASGTDGGSSTSGSWQTRTLNTKTGDADGLCTLASNAFALTPGAYYADFSAPAYNSSFHQIRLRDTVNGTIYYGTSEFNVTNAQTRSRIARVILAGPGNSWLLEHRVQSSQATNGYGVANSFGGTEVYAQGTLTPLTLNV